MGSIINAILEFLDKIGFKFFISLFKINEK